MNFSRNKRAIIEEYIDNEIADIHGDGFVINSKLVFSCLGDHIYNAKANPFNPTGTKWPSKLSKSIIEQIETDIAKIIQFSGFSYGPINIEARINHQKHFIMEIDHKWRALCSTSHQYATGFNMVEAFLDILEGKKPDLNYPEIKPTTYIALYSEEEGILKEIIINNKLTPFIKEYYQYIQPGEKVKPFKGANAAIGILLLSFNTIEEMDYYISNINNFISLQITSE